MTIFSIRSGNQAESASQLAAPSPRTSTDSLEDLLSLPLLGEDTYEMGDRRSRAGAPPDLESQLLLRRLEGRSRWRFPDTARVQRLKHAFSTFGSRLQCPDAEQCLAITFATIGVVWGGAIIALIFSSFSGGDSPAEKNATAGATASIMSATVSFSRRALASATASAP